MQHPLKTTSTQNKVKHLYSFLNFLIITNHTSKSFQFIQFFCNEAQYIVILLWTQASFFVSNDSNPAFKYIYSSTRFLTLQKVFEEDLSSSLLLAFSVIVWIYFGFMSIMIAYLIYKAIKKQKISSLYQNFVSSVLQFHSVFIFWIANMILMTTMKLKQQDLYIPLLSSGQVHNQVFYGLQVLFLILNYGLGSITSLFCFDLLCPNSSFAIKTPILQFLNFLLKAIIAPLIAFFSSKNSDIQVLIIVVTIIVNAMRVYLVHSRFPFYHLTAMKIMVSSTSIALWISLTNIMGIILFNKGLESSYSLVYIVILPLPIIIKISLVGLQRSVEHYITAPHNKINTTRQVYGKLFVYDLLLEKVKLTLNNNVSFDRYELYFLGKLTSHSKSCKDQGCFCQYYLYDNNIKTKGNLENTKDSLTSYLSSMRIMFLLEAIPRIQNSYDLELNLSHSLMSKSINNLNTSLIYVFSSNRSSWDFFIRLKRHILIQDIEEKIVGYYGEGSDGKLDMLNFVNYQDDTIRFLEQIKLSTNQYINFWESYKKSNLKMRDIIQKSNDIEKLAYQIDKLWTTNIIKHEAFYHLTKDLYRIYLSIVRNTPSTSAEIINKYKWKKKLREFDPTTVLITNDDLRSIDKLLTINISMMRERVGRVTYAAGNIQNAIGFTEREVVGRNINVLMPHVFAEKHDQFLLQHLHKSKASSLQKEYFRGMTYIKTKSGFIVPCSIYTSIFPYIQKELVYTGVIKILKTKFDYILLDSEGYIDSFTEKIGRRLCFSLNRKVHLKDVCLDYERLDSYFNSHVTDRWEMMTEKHSEISRVFKNLQSRAHNYENNQDNQTENICNLTFLTRDGTNKYMRCDVRLTKKLLLNKTVYILELERISETKRLLKSSRTFWTKDEILEKPTDDSVLEIPTERIVSQDTQIADNINEYRESGIGYTTSRSEVPLKNILTNRKVFTHYGSSENYGDRTTKSYKRGFSTLRTTPMGSIEDQLNFTSDSDSEVSGNRKKISIPSPGPRKNVRQQLQSEIGSTASTARKNVTNKLEEAIYSLPVNRSLRILKGVSGLLFIISLVLIIVFHTQTMENLAYVKQNVSVMTTSSLRLFQVTTLHSRVRMISLCLNNMIADTRYLAYGLYPLVPLAMMLVDVIQQNLTTYNNHVAISLQEIEASLQAQLFNNVIPVVDPELPNDTKYLNIFEAANVLSVKAKMFALQNPFTVTPTNPAMNFVLNNTLNEQIVVSEQVTDILVQDNDLKFTYLEGLILYFTLICLLIGAIMLISFTYDLVKSLKSRNKFIDLFLQLDNEDIDKNLSRVKLFNSGLAKDGLSFKAAQLENIPSQSNQLAKIIKGVKPRKKEADMQGINTRVSLSSSVAILLFLLFFIPFIVINVVIENKKTIIKQQVNSIVQVNSNLYDFNLLVAALYDYIQFNGTTQIRGQPINEEFEKTLGRLSGSLEVFTDLLNVKNDDQVVNDAKLKLLLTGNLCTALSVDQMMCLFAKENAERGIIGMNTFLLSTLRTAKDMFDESDRTINSAKQVLTFSSLLDLEYIYTMLQLPVYQMLGEILERRVKMNIQEVEDSMRLLFYVSAGVYIVLGYVVSSFLWRIIEEERVKWKKMLRKIPFNIAVSNKAFKSYLVKECAHLLDSVKNSL